MDTKTHLATQENIYIQINMLTACTHMMEPKTYPRKLLGAGKEAYQKVRVHPVMLVSDIPFQLSLSRLLLATTLGCKNYAFKK